jgi:hypothetical protein
MVLRALGVAFECTGGVREMKWGARRSVRHQSECSKQILCEQVGSRQPNALQFAMTFVSTQGVTG